MTLNDNLKYKSIERFSGLASKYALGRPGYPKEAIDFIIKHCQLEEGDTIADIGCGTGISSRIFAKHHLQVKGIEPNKDMRQQAIKESAESGDFEVQYIKSTAEETGLANNSVDLVVCAQAFHWFEPDKSLAEFHRILKNNAWLVLMWNERDDSDPFTNEYSQLIRTVAGAEQLEIKRSKAGEVLLQYPIFSNVQRVLFANSQSVDKNGLLNRAFSTSYAPNLTESADQFAKALNTLFAKHQIDDKVTFAYITSVYLAQRKST